MINDLIIISKSIRKNIIINSHRNKIPHLGSCLSVVDILVFIYLFAAKIKKNNLKKNTRDRVILSKGHAAPTLFMVLQSAGLNKTNVLEEYAKNFSVLGEHPPTPNYYDGIEAATGSLGHGFSMGIGMALASKIKKYNNRIFTVLGDGELNEGVIWEGAMFASANNLNNLFAYIDFNKWQATGRSLEIINIDNLKKKWVSFGWDAYILNGHDYNQFHKTFLKSINNYKPSVFICNTIKGKGISFMEDDNNWHYKIPDDNDLLRALKELD